MLPFQVSLISSYSTAINIFKERHKHNVCVSVFFNLSFLSEPLSLQAFYSVKADAKVRGFSFISKFN